MESNKNNSPNSPGTETENTDDGTSTTASLSTSPKRYKLDPDAPSTSNQHDCNTNPANGSDNTNTTNPDPGNVHDNVDDDDDDDDGDDDDNATMRNCDAENKAKSISNRIAKRNYRRRSDSQSSTNSVPMPPMPEQSNENSMNSNRNNREDTPESPPFVALLDDDSTFSSDQDDSPDEDDSTSESYSDDSTVNKKKAQDLLNKPTPKCDLNLVRNLIYRQSGVLYKGDRRTYDGLATGLIYRIGSSIYSVERMKQLHTLDRHHGCVNCLNFNKAGNLLVTGSDDLKVIVWNWAKRQPIVVQASGHRSNVFQSKFVDNGSASNQHDFHLITSARDGEVRSIQVAPDGTSKERIITRHLKAVHKIVMPDPNEVLTASEDGCVMRSDLRDTKSPEQLLHAHDKGEKIMLYSIAHHPFDPEFCICGRDKFVRVYDKRNMKECSKMFCPDHILKRTKMSSYINITCAVYNYIGTEILASYGNENIYLFDTADNTPGRYKNTYYGHKNRQTIKGVNFFGACSEFVMSGSDCGNFFMWDKNNESIVQWLTADERGAVNCLEGHPYFPIIATSGLGHDVKIWYPINADGRPSQIELKKCIDKNLKKPRDRSFVRTHIRNITRLLNGRYHHDVGSNSDDDSSDSDDEDDGLRTFYRHDRGPCEVQ